jgi:hypothetical protein
MYLDSHGSIEHAARADRRQVSGVPRADQGLWRSGSALIDRPSIDYTSEVAGSIPASPARRQTCCQADIAQCSELRSATT